MRRSVLPILTLGVLMFACARTPVTVRATEAVLRAPELSALEALEHSVRLDEAAAYRGGEWHPAYFDELLPSEALSIEGLRHRHRRDGVGVPLTGLRLPSGEAEAFYPPEGITRPLTAVMLHDASGAPRLRLLDPATHLEVPTDEGTKTLAADFTAPYALLLSRTRFGELAIAGTLRHDALEERAGIFLLEPYDAAKTPLLMVHGLLSSPVTWRELTNEVFGDEEIRARYQVWHAVYPAGIPYLHNAADLRERLLDLRQRLDPEGDDFATSHIVVVAHSMGGLLAKTLIADSGNDLWSAAFKVPPEQLAASPEDRKEMERFLFFERDPAVRRAIFIATPHRGSRLAENPLARFLASWVSLPSDKRDPFGRVLSDNADALTPAFDLRRQTGLPSGPRALSDLDPLIEPLASLSVDPAIPFHTIVGQPQRGVPSDGVVDHESSLLTGANSELVVAGSGHDVHQSEQAIAEVMRILREHKQATDAVQGEEPAPVRKRSFKDGSAAGSVVPGRSPSDFR